MNRRDVRLMTLQTRIKQQIVETECLQAALEDYCRDNPDEKPCAASDPAWLQQLARQREELGALLGAIREKLETASAV